MEQFLIDLFTSAFVLGLSMQFWIIGMHISCWLTMELQENMEQNSFWEENLRSTYPFRNCIKVRIAVCVVVGQSCPISSYKES
jgi:hypothetical protein